MSLTGPCTMTICKGQSSKWKMVTEHVISKGQANNTLPNYIHLGNVICLKCYNRIVTRSSTIFQQHAQITNTEQPETDNNNNKIDEVWILMKLQILIRLRVLTLY